MTALPGRHCARLHEVTRPITAARIAKAMELEHWRHRRHLSADERFGWLVLAVALLVVGGLAGFVSGWSR